MATGYYTNAWNLKMYRDNKIDRATYIINDKYINSAISRFAGR